MQVELAQLEYMLPRLTRMWTHLEKFRGGIGMIASRLDIPVVPVRVDGVDRILHMKNRMARPGRVRVAFGAPLHLHGDDYQALAREVEARVRSL